MLYGHPSSTTSYTTFRVDGVNQIFASNTPTVFDSENNSCTKTYAIGDISINQILTLKKNISTNREDTVEIKYVVTNTGEEYHDAGVRIMMDTMLGNNDAAPFRIPGIGAVTTELEFSGDSIPEYWQAFDSLTDPSVISQGTLLTKTNKPDKVQFTNWSRVYDKAWDYTVNPSSSNGDSAVSVIWNEAPLEPGETQEYTTYYGLSEFEQDMMPPLGLSITGPSNLEIVNNEYNPNPFTVSAYVINTGTVTANNVIAKLNLPENFKLDYSEALEKNIGTLASGEEKQVSWIIYIAPHFEDTSKVYSVSVAADGCDAKTVARTVQIPALQMIDDYLYTNGDDSINDGTSCAAGDPVNIATGNFFTHNTDISLTGNTPISFTRFYNSQDKWQGVLGENWHNNYEYKLQNIGDKVRIIFDDGHAEDFTTNQDGTYTPMVGKHNSLSLSEGIYTLKTSDNTSYIFNTDGNLTEVKELNGATISLTYDAGKLVKLSSDNGSLVFEYNEQALIQKITALDINNAETKSVAYTYVDGNLTGYTNEDGAISGYEYDAESKIVKVIDALGITFISNIYDDKGRVIEQTFADGTKDYFQYNENDTIYTNRNGSITKYIKDTAGRIHQIETANGSDSKIFNDKNQITSYTDKNGNTYTYEFDNNGNVTKETDALGNITTYQYDINNKITSLTNPDGSQCTYTYDNEGNLLTATDPLGRSMSIEYNSKALPVKVILPNNSFSTFQYDENGNVVVETDADGNITSYTYDSQNRIKTVTKPNGNKVEYEYKPSGKVQKVIYPNGTSATTEYDARGLVKEEIDIAGRKTQYTYNSIGNIETITDALGGITRYEYDSMWNVSKIVLPDGSTNTYKYNLANQLEAVADAEGNTTTYGFDANNNITKEISPNTSETNYMYDALNRISTVTNANGAKTSYEYRYDGQLTKVMDALNGSIEYQYDAAGQLLSLTNQIGAQTKYTYNALGLVETTTEPNGSVTSYEYNNNEKITKVTNSDGSTEKMEYDGNGNIIKHTDAKGKATVYSYDIMDRLTMVTNTLGGTKKIEYTPAGKVSAMIDENKNRTTYSYDELDRLATVTDAKGNTTTYVYDAVGNLTEVHKMASISQKIQSNQKFSKTRINKCGNTTNTTTMQEIITKYKYDKRGLLIEETNPANKITVYSYDKNGNLISKTDRDSKTTKYEYDAINNLSKIEYADGRKVEYQYNPLSQITAMTDWNGTTNYELDALGRIKQVKDYQDKVTKYTWSNQDQKESITYPDGSIVGYTYDAMGRLAKVTDAQNKVTKYSYDSTGNLIEKLLPNGVKTTNSYDDLSRLTSITDVDARGKIIDQYKYSYDAVGNKTIIDRKKNRNRDGKDDKGKCWDYKEHRRYEIDVKCGDDKPSDQAIGETQYKYDQLNQLIEVKNPNGTVEKYYYDSLGNRTSKEYISKNSRNKATTDYRYDIQNRLIEVDGKNEIVAGALTNKPVTIEYDDRGNLTKLVSGGKTIGQYEFDATNKMTSSINKYGIVSKYEYDGAGRRIKMSVELPKHKIPAKGKMDAEMKKTCDDIFGDIFDDTGYKKEYNYINDVTSQYSNVLMVYGKHNETQRYTYGLDVLSVDTWKSADNFDSDITSGKSKRAYYLQDELGSPIKLIDDCGKVKASFEYDAFGKPLAETYISELKASYNIFSYTGYQFDEITGLMFAQARYYMPEVGRFISEDTYKGEIVEPQSLNLYVYVKNNPNMYIDPSGNLNYFTQCDDYRAGVKRGAGDWIGDILNTPSALFDVGKELIFGDLTVKKLIKAGLSGLVEDYTYIWDHKSAFLPWKSVCDKDVNELGYHMGKILLDVASAIVGGKLVSSLSKTKTGQKIISKINKASKAAFKAAAKIDDFIVSNKHLMSAGGRWQKFATDSKDLVNDWIKEGLTSKKAQFLPNNKDGSFKIITDLGRKIGTKGETKIQIIIGDDGKIWTAYPIK